MKGQARENPCQEKNFPKTSAEKREEKVKLAFFLASLFVTSLVPPPTFVLLMRKK